MHGARVIQIEGNFDQALTLVRDVKERYPTRLALVNSVNPRPHRGPEDGGVRDLRRARPRARLPPPAGRQRRQHHRLLAGLPRVPRGRASSRRRPRMMGFEAAGAAPIVHGRVVEEPRTIATAIRIGNPASWDGADRGARRVGRRHRGDRRRGHPRRLPAARAHRGRLRRARVGHQPRGRAALGARGRLRPRRRARADAHRARPQGSRHRDRQLRGGALHPRRSRAAGRRAGAGLSAGVADEVRRRGGRRDGATSRSPSSAARRRSRSARTPNLDHMASRGILGLTRTMPRGRAARRRRRHAWPSSATTRRATAPGARRFEAAGLGVEPRRPATSRSAATWSRSSGARTASRSMRGLRRRPAVHRRRRAMLVGDLARGARGATASSCTPASAIATSSSGAAASTGVRTTPPHALTEQAGGAGAAARARARSVLRDLMDRARRGPARRIPSARRGARAASARRTPSGCGDRGRARALPAAARALRRRGRGGRRRPTWCAASARSPGLARGRRARRHRLRSTRTSAARPSTACGRSTTRDFLFLHVDAPDEGGHLGDAQQKIAAIERLDEDVLGPLLDGLRARGGEWRVMVMAGPPDARARAGRTRPIRCRSSSTCRRDEAKTHGAEARLSRARRARAGHLRPRGAHAARAPAARLRGGPWNATSRWSWSG